MMSRKAFNRLLKIEKWIADIEKMLSERGKTCDAREISDFNEMIDGRSQWIREAVDEVEKTVEEGQLEINLLKGSLSELVARHQRLPV